MVVTRHFRQPEFLTFLNAFVPSFQMVLIKFFEKPEYLPKNHKTIILIKVAFCQYGKIRPVYYIPAVRNSTQLDLQDCGRPPIYNLGGRNSPFFIGFSYINPFQLHGPDFFHLKHNHTTRLERLGTKKSNIFSAKKPGENRFLALLYKVRHDELREIQI